MAITETRLYRSSSITVEKGGSWNSGAISANTELADSQAYSALIVLTASQSNDAPTDVIFMVDNGTSLVQTASTLYVQNKSDDQWLIKPINTSFNESTHKEYRKWYLNGGNDGDNNNFIYTNATHFRIRLENNSYRAKAASIIVSLYIYYGDAITFPSKNTTDYINANDMELLKQYYHDQAYVKGNTLALMNSDNITVPTKGNLITGADWNDYINMYHLFNPDVQKTAPTSGLLATAQYFNSFNLS